MKEEKRKYIRTEQEVSKEPTDYSKIKYVRNDLMEKIIKNCREVKQCNDGINRMEKEKQIENFRAILGFKKHDIMTTKEHSVLKSVIDAFEGENMQTQYSILDYRIYLYFHDYKLAIEVYEKGHKDRNIGHELKRQEAIKEKLGCEFIRINPDENNFNFFKTINEIHRHINESIKKSTKETFRKLLKFKLNNSIKTKCSTYVVKHIFPTK